MFSGDVQRQGRTATGFLFKFIFYDHISGTKVEASVLLYYTNCPILCVEQKEESKRKWAFFMSGKHDGATISK